MCAERERERERERDSFAGSDHWPSSGSLAPATEKALSISVLSTW